MGRITSRCQVVRVRVGAPNPASARPDTVIVEEPLEIRLDGAPLAVTMRTPGADVHLVHGFLLSEGIITAATDVVSARYCAGAVETDDSGHPRNTFNVLDVRLAPGVPPPAVDPSRRFLTTSACGVCGKTSIDAIRQRVRWPVADAGVRFDPAVLVGLPAALRTTQTAFAKTGGVHAAGLFTAEGTLVEAAEDVGRHNAVDKVLGAALLAGLLPARAHVLVVSGRASFELTQKALVAGVPALAAVSAPSSMAVALAEEAGMTLLGFVRPPAFNAYAGAHRLRLPAPEEPSSPPGPDPRRPR